MRKLVLALVFISFTSAVMVAASVIAAPESNAAQLSTQYAGWAGGKANPGSLVTVRFAPETLREGVSPGGGPPAAR